MAIFFARALVFFEGETEEQALPDFAEKFWHKRPNDLGHSFIGVGGYGNYLPFLRMAQSFKIPWFIFSDGGPAAVTAINTALTAIDQVDDTGEFSSGSSARWQGLRGVHRER